MTAIARMLGIVFAIACGALAALGADAAHAGARVALIVGNSDYRYVTPLPNPERDAKLMAKTLRDLGFTIVNGGAQLNLDKQQFDRAVQDFGNAAQGADVALFYYAGHGVQVHGVNYLVPVGANPTKESDVNFQMFDANLVLRVLDSAGARLNLVILDACRNNPFRVSRLRAVSSGLAQMQAPEGTLISFATQPGNVASDGDSGHSPFTEALTQTILKPGLDIFRTFNEVGLQVAKTTGGEQQPWLSISPIKGDFYFGGAPNVAATRPKPDPMAEQRQNYEAAERVGTKEAWASFLNVYPQGYMADLARAQRGKIVAQERAQQRAEAAAAEQARREAEAEAARKASEQAARDEAVKVAAVARAHSAAETKQARAAAEKARKEAAAEKAKREAEAKAAQAELEKARRETAAAEAAKHAAEKAAQEAIASLEKAEQSAARSEVPPQQVALASPPPASAVARLNEANIRTLAKKQDLPLPEHIRIVEPSATVPKQIAGYLGVWGGDRRWAGRGRHVMLMVMTVDEKGAATGFFAFGPPTQYTFNQNPANYWPFSGKIVENRLEFTSPSRRLKYRFTIMPSGIMKGHMDAPHNRHPSITIGRIN